MRALILCLTLIAPQAFAATSATFSRDGSKVSVAVNGNDADGKALFQLLAGRAEIKQGKYVKHAAYRAFGQDRLVFHCIAPREDGTSADCTVQLLGGPNAVLDVRKKTARYFLVEDIEASRIAPLFNPAADPRKSEIYTSRNKKLSLILVRGPENRAQQFRFSYAQ